MFSVTDPSKEVTDRYKLRERKTQDSGDAVSKIVR